MYIHMYIYIYMCIYIYIHTYIYIYTHIYGFGAFSWPPGTSYIFKVQVCFLFAPSPYINVCIFVAMMT